MKISDMKILRMKKKYKLRYNCNDMSFRREKFLETYLAHHEISLLINYLSISCRVIGNPRSQATLFGHALHMPLP